VNYWVMSSVDFGGIRLPPPSVMKRYEDRMWSEGVQEWL